MGAQNVSGYIKIADGEGDGTEVVERALYDRIFSEATRALETGGSAAALALKKTAHLATTPPVRAAILLTIVEKRPDGTARLRTADEANHYRV